MTHNNTNNNNNKNTKKIEKPTITKPTLLPINQRTRLTKEMDIKMVEQRREREKNRNWICWFNTKPQWSLYWSKEYKNVKTFK